MRKHLLPLILMVGSTAAAGQFPVELIARTGENAPVMADHTLEEIKRGVHNIHGDVAIVGTVATRDPFVRPYCIWAGKIGALRLVARSDVDVPGTPGLKITNADEIYLDGKGNLILYGRYSAGHRETGNALWFGSPDRLKLVARSGDKIPGVRVPCDNVVYETTLANGTMVVSGRYPSKNVLYMGPPDDFRAIAMPGRKLPGPSGDVRFDAIASRASVNSKGELAFIGSTDHLKPGRESGVVWIGNATSFKAVLRSGDPAPGMPGEKLGQLSLAAHNPSLADDGTIALIAATATDSWSQPRRIGIWMGKPDSLRLVVENDRPPVQPNTAPLFMIDFDSLKFDSHGRLFFTGTIRIPRKEWANWSLRFYNGKAMRTVVTQNTPVSVAGLPPGMDCLIGGNVPCRASDDGVVLAIAEVQPKDRPAGETTQGSGLIVWAPSTGWRLVARAGDTLNGADGKPIGTVQTFTWVEPPTTDGRFLVICKMKESNELLMCLAAVPK